MKRNRGGACLLGVLLASIVLTPHVAWGAGALETLDQELAAYAKKIQQALTGREQRVVAVLPFVDAALGVRMLGQMAAMRLEDKLSALGGLRVADRIGLDAVMKEKRAWQADFFEERDPAKVASASKLLKADFFVRGTMFQTADEVHFVLRVVETASAGVIGNAGGSFSIPATEEVLNLLPNVQRPANEARKPYEVPPVELTFSVLAQHRAPNGMVRDFVLEEGGALQSGDQYRIQFAPLTDSYVYIFYRGSTGTCGKLFPFPGIRLGNFCRGGVSYTVPDQAADGEQQWYRLDDNPGKEAFFIVACHEPMKDLDAVVARMQQVPVDQLRQEIEKIRKGADRSSASDGTFTIRRIPSMPERNRGTMGHVFEGNFALVREFTFEHRP